MQREIWNQKIRGQFAYTISSVRPRTIDEKGIAYAAKLAVKRCIRKLNSRFQFLDSKYLIVLDGGLKAPAIYVNQETIIRGDENHPLIAAASIVAKVHRDRYMARLHKKLPQYGFAQHKGYGTRLHTATIGTYGLSKHHRATFCKNLT